MTECQYIDTLIYVHLAVLRDENSGETVCKWLWALPSASTYTVQVSPKSSRAVLSLHWKYPGRCQNSAIHTWLHCERDRGCPYLLILCLLQATCLTIAIQPPSHDTWCLSARKYVCHAGSCPWTFFGCEYVRAWYNIGWLVYWKVSLWSDQICLLTLK